MRLLTRSLQNFKEAKPFGTPNSPVRQQQAELKPPGTFMRTNPSARAHFCDPLQRQRSSIQTNTIKAETSVPSSSNEGQMQSFFESRNPKNKHSSNASPTSKSHVKSETPMHSTVIHKSSRVLPSPSSSPSTKSVARKQLNASKKVKMKDQLSLKKQKDDFYIKSDNINSSKSLLSMRTRNRQM